MANEYGWPEDLEQNLVDRAATEDVNLAMQYCRGDALVDAYLQIYDLNQTLASYGDDVGPEYYDWVQQVVPVGKLPVELAGKVSRAAAGAGGGPDLWVELTTTLADIEHRMYAEESFGHFNATILKPWLGSGYAPQKSDPAGGTDEGGGGWQASEGGYRQTPTDVGGGADNSGGMLYGGQDGDEPPPMYPLPPDTLDECWVDAAWGDHFRAWIEQTPVGTNSKLCWDIEQEFVGAPSWESALTIYVRYLDDDAASRPYVNPDSVDAIRAALPQTDEDYGTPPPGDLYAALHEESVATLLAAYDTYKADPYLAYGAR